MKGDLPSVRILRRGSTPGAGKDKRRRIPSDLQPEGFGIGTASMLKRTLWEMTMMKKWNSGDTSERLTLARK